MVTQRGAARGIAEPDAGRRRVGEQQQPRPGPVVVRLPVHSSSSPTLSATRTCTYIYLADRGKQGPGLDKMTLVRLPLRQPSSPGACGRFRGWMRGA